MMRLGALVCAVALGASGAAADPWSARISTSGAVTTIYDISGTENTIMSDTRGIYMSAEAYADGVDSRGTTCATAAQFEIDYFFGDEAAFGGHILFTLIRSAGRFDAVDPAVFLDTLQPNGDIIETYADFDTVSLAILSAECLPDGSLAMAVNYKGNLLSGTGMGPQAVRISGSADAHLILKDMNEY